VNLENILLEFSFLRTDKSRHTRRKRHTGRKYDTLTDITIHSQIQSRQRPSGRSPLSLFRKIFLIYSWPSKSSYSERRAKVKILGGDSPVKYPFGGVFRNPGYFVPILVALQQKSSFGASLFLRIPPLLTLENGQPRRIDSSCIGKKRLHGWYTSASILSQTRIRRKRLSG